MRPDTEQTLAWEARWSRPAGVAALGAVALVIAAIVVAAQGVGPSDGDADLLRQVDQHRAAQLISSILQGVGVGLLAVPLYFLFRAARERSEAMRGQLVGVVVAAPLFLAALAILTGVSTLQAATDFLAKGITGVSSHANDVASDTIRDAPLRPLATGFGLGGQIGFVVAMFYTSLHAMRVGLLTRFWGSLGMALGAVSFLFFQFALLWFVYLGIVLLAPGRGERMPAWDTGKAAPWPGPGEGPGPNQGGKDDAEEEAAVTSVELGEPRKRKRRA